jgi:putative DNA primase/helicase
LWGRGSAESGIIRSWNSTGNALEGVAAGSTNTGLFIDELGQADGRQIYTAIYALANGKGRSRLNSDSSLRDTREWLVMILSTSEVPIGTKLEEDSGRSTWARPT